MGFFTRLKDALKKTKANIGKKFFEMFKGKALDDEFYEALEMALITADAGVEATDQILEQLKWHTYQNKIRDPEKARDALKRVLLEQIQCEFPEYKYPLVLLISGVNGVGKTTTIGKLAKNFLDQGKSVIIAAADTFRAAASEQLEIWAERAGVRIVKHTEGSDPAAVVFDTISSAIAKNTDVVLVDTAGRLHNKKNLMEELKKIKRVISRTAPHADIRNFLVLDATMGQNSLSQAEAFDDDIEINGIILTKLDSTAKGGIVFALITELVIPVVYVGVGEKIDDLIPFDPESFVEGIFD
ncbi:MAG: signal recognition particle-docking protein FtsY [Christensenellaceae bacterium]|jgi:fused signal recognition particle receptor|nr:signal recognition particle-docking protein FtsY [Christensenellaceae bacterium]